MPIISSCFKGHSPTFLKIDAMNQNWHVSYELTVRTKKERNLEQKYKMF